MAITKFDQFDFLIDIVPRDELKPPKRQVSVLCVTDVSLLKISQQFLTKVRSNQTFVFSSLCNSDCRIEGFLRYLL